MQNIESRIQDLKEAAEKLFIKVEVANLNDQEFTVQSGYCKLNGEDLIILDKNLPEEEHMMVILNTLKNMIMYLLNLMLLQFFMPFNTF